MTPELLFTFRELLDFMIWLNNFIRTHFKHGEATLDICIHIFLPLYV